jgi:hypothetical protein
LVRNPAGSQQIGAINVAKEWDTVLLQGLALWDQALRT